MKARAKLSQPPFNHSVFAVRKQGCEPNRWGRLAELFAEAKDRTFLPSGAGSEVTETACRASAAIRVGVSKVGAAGSSGSAEVTLRVCCSQSYYK